MPIIDRDLVVQLMLLLLLSCHVQPTHATRNKAAAAAPVINTAAAAAAASHDDDVVQEQGGGIVTTIAVASIRNGDYAPDESAAVLANIPDLRQQQPQHQQASHFFPRFQSPDSIQRLVDGIIRRHQASSSSSSAHRHPFHKHIGPNHREGYIRSTKLSGTDWVLAESKQIAVDCTTEDVLMAYLSGRLQTQWNQDKVIDCRITLKKEGNSPTFGSNSKDDNNKNELQQQQQQPPCYYQQDLVLKSQRVITSHTGVMRYSQKIVIDKIVNNNNNNNNNKNAKYCVSIQMMDPTTTGSETTTTTVKKPFEALCVHVNLEPSSSSHPNNNNNSVYVYAAGLLKVNRQVVPNLVVFDASGIAGSMAGKGTLWLTAYFKQRQVEKMQQRQEQQQQQQQHTLSRRRGGPTAVAKSSSAVAVLACRRRHAQRAWSLSSSSIISHNNHNKNRSHIIAQSWQRLLLPPWSSSFL